MEGDGAKIMVGIRIQPAPDPVRRSAPSPGGAIRKRGGQRCGCARRPFGLRYPIPTLETEAHSRGEDQVWSGLWGDCTTYYVIAEATDGGQVKGKLSLHQ